MICTLVADDNTESSSASVHVFFSVNELVHCACDCAGRTPADHITFAEFSILVTELREQYRKK